MFLTFFINVYKRFFIICHKKAQLVFSDYLKVQITTMRDDILRTYYVQSSAVLAVKYNT